MPEEEFAPLVSSSSSTEINEQNASSKCVKIVKKRVPITSWLPKYTISTGLQDGLAGLTVALTEIPQGIAYAIVAGLGAQYGLYSGFMGCFMYGIFGSCKDINVGPTAIMALMVQPHVEKYGPDMAVLLTFLSGAIIFVLGFLKLGFLVEFISFPVTVGFTAAAALQIASSQIKSLLGISGKANEFLEAWITVVEHISETKLWDTLLGVLTMIILMIMKEFKRFGGLQYNPEWSPRRNYFGRTMWLLSLARNALLVMIGTIISYCLIRKNGMPPPFAITGEVQEGLPPFQPPPFSTIFNNTEYNFGDMAKQFGETIIFAPIIAILEHVAIAKAFAKGKTLDITQEMIALGLSNVMGSFVRSIPVTGSFTRTAVNNASGVQTPLAGVLTGSLVLVALTVLTSTFYYIPKATLAAVVIASMFNLIEVEAVILLWKTKKLDLIPLFVTFLACLFLGLEYGIVIGVATNLLFILYPAARPPITVEEKQIEQQQIYLVTPTKHLLFPSAEFFREKVMKKCTNRSKIIVINCQYLNSIDATVAKNFKVLSDDLKLRGQQIIFYQFNKTVKDTCLGIDPKMELIFIAGSSLETIIIKEKEKTEESIHNLV